MTETIYKPSQIVCVKPGSSDSHLFIIACLQEHVSAGMKRAKAKFKMLSIKCCLPKIQRDVSMSATRIVCTMTCYNYCDDVLELEESDLTYYLMNFSIPVKLSPLQKQPS